MRPWYVARPMPAERSILGVTVIDSDGFAFIHGGVPDVVEVGLLIGSVDQPWVLAAKDVDGTYTFSLKITDDGNPLDLHFPTLRTFEAVGRFPFTLQIGLRATTDRSIVWTNWQMDMPVTAVELVMGSLARPWLFTVACQDDIRWMFQISHGEKGPNVELHRLVPVGAPGPILRA